MKNDSRQTMTLIGIALLVIAGILLFITLRQPAVYEENTDVKTTEIQVVTTETEAEPETDESEPITVAETEKQESPTVEVHTGSNVKYPINLNTATLEELMSIREIGEYRASAILEYRDSIGKYKSVEQIKNIKGFDDALYNSISGYLCV